MDADEPPRLLSVRTIHKGFSTFVMTRVRLADGSEVDREVEDHGDAVAVLPYDPARKAAMLVRLFRAPVFYKGAGVALTEAPAGLIDPGETADQAARREAWEETGLVLDTLEPVASLWASPGVSAERITLFLAPCRFEGRGAGGGKPGENEGITVLEVALADLGARLDRGDIEDMKLLALAQALRLRRPELFA